MTMSGNAACTTPPQDPGSSTSGRGCAASRTVIGTVETSEARLAIFDPTAPSHSRAGRASNHAWCAQGRMVPEALHVSARPRGGAPAHEVCT